MFAAATRAKQSTTTAAYPARYGMGIPYSRSRIETLLARRSGPPRFGDTKLIALLEESERYWEAAARGSGQ